MINSKKIENKVVFRLENKTSATYNNIDKDATNDDLETFRVAIGRLFENRMSDFKRIDQYILTEEELD